MRTPAWLEYAHRSLDPHAYTKKTSEMQICMRRHNKIWCTHVGQEIPVLVYYLLICKLVVWYVGQQLYIAAFSFHGKKSFGYQIICILSFQSLTQQKSKHLAYFKAEHQIGQKGYPHNSLLSAEWIEYITEKIRKYAYKHSTLLDFLTSNI